jgi:hypothetical protein
VTVRDRLIVARSNDNHITPPSSPAALSSALQGDLNGNNVVDASDYVLWRKNASPSSPIGSGSDAAGNPDYQTWRQNFGNSLGDAAGRSDQQSVATIFVVTVPASAGLPNVTVGSVSKQGDIEQQTKNFQGDSFVPSTAIIQPKASSSPAAAPSVIENLFSLNEANQHRTLSGRLGSTNRTSSLSTDHTALDWVAVLAEIRPPDISSPQKFLETEGDRAEASADRAFETYDSLESVIVCEGILTKFNDLRASSSSAVNWRHY